MWELEIERSFGKTGGALLPILHFRPKVWHSMTRRWQKITAGAISSHFRFEEAAKKLLNWVEERQDQIQHILSELQAKTCLSLRNGRCQFICWDQRRPDRILVGFVKVLRHTWYISMNMLTLSKTIRQKIQVWHSSNVDEGPDDEIFFF